MARMYAAIPYDYLEEMETLSDAEFGRLVRALVTYSKDGATPALSGNERIVWPRVKMQEDRFKASYAESVQNRSAAASKAAAARWGIPTDANECERIRTHTDASERIPTDANECERIRTHTDASERIPTDANECERIRTHTDASERIPTDANECDTMRKDALDANTNTNTNIDISCGGGSGGDSAQVRDPELASVISYYSQKVNACFGHAESNGLVEAYRQFGADVVICAIDNALAANKPSWAYIRGIINRWKRQGVKTLADVQRIDADFEAQKQAKQTAARQQHSQPKPKKTSFADMAKQAMQQEELQDDIIEADWSEVQ